MKFKSYIKKFTAAALIAAVSSTVGITAPAVYAHDYDNIINEVYQIRDYTIDGLYLEAIHECENVLYYRDISPADERLLNTMKDAAAQMYSFYKDYHNYSFFNMKRADYDGNLTVEAFAAEGKRDSYFSDLGSSVNLWYIDATHCQHLKNTYGYAMDLASTWYQKFYVWEEYAGGSGGRSYVFGVRNGEPYQPNISGKYDCFNDQNGYTAIVHDFSRGFHDYVDVFFRFDDASGQFYRK